MYGIGLIVWCVIAIALAGALSRLVKLGWKRRITFLLLAPMVFLLPLIDELIGKFKFDELCKAAEEVEIYGTIPVREPFYTSDGKWRRSGSGQFLGGGEVNLIEQAYEGLVRYERRAPTKVSALIPIYQYEWRIMDRHSDAVLVSIRQFGTRGGWLSRYAETPAIVRAQCPSPAFFEALDQKILPFDKHSGDSK